MDLVDQYRALIADVYELAGRSRATSESLARARGQTAARWHVLSVVSDQPLTVPAIATRLGLTRQSVQRVVDDLRASGHVDLATNPEHRRSSLVAITPAGERVASELFRDSTAARRAQLRRAGLDDRDLARARHTVRRLLDALDELEAG